MKIIPAEALVSGGSECAGEGLRSGQALIVAPGSRPVEKRPPPLFGRARRSVVHAAEDAFAPAPESWDALEA